MPFTSRIKPEDLAKLNAKIKDNAAVDREHLLEFLTLIPTNDGPSIVEEVKEWLTALHLDPTYDKIIFPDGHIEAVLGDLDSYGRVKVETILQFKEKNARTAGSL